MATSVNAETVARCLARRDYLAALNMLTDSKADSNLLFVQDLKNALSPFLNTCGLLELIATSSANLNAQIAFDDAVSTFKARDVAQGQGDELLGDGLAWLTPEIDSARGEALQAGKDFQRGLKTHITEIEQLSLAIVSALAALTSKSEEEFDASLGDAIRNGQKNLPITDILLYFETIERKLDQWDVKVAGLREALAEPSSGQSATSAAEVASRNRKRARKARSSRSDPTDEPHLIALDMLDPMERNRKRFSLTMASSLPALSAMRAMMVAASVKSGYTPIGTLLPAVYGSALSEAGPDVWPDEDKRSTPPPFSSNLSKLVGFNDPGYVNAPYLHATLTFFLSHLTNGPDAGVNWDGLVSVTELRSLLDEITARSALSESTSSASRELKILFKNVLAVLGDIDQVLASKARQVSVADVGVDRVNGWRTKVKDARNISAKYATAVVIPGISLNTPEWPATNKSPQTPPLPESHIDRCSYLTTGLFHLHAEHETILNTLAYQTASAKSRERLKTSLTDAWNRARATGDGGLSKACFTDVLDSYHDLSETLRQHMHGIKGFMLAVSAMMKVWLPGQDNSGDGKGSAASGKSFYREMKLISAFLHRSYFELFSEMLKPLRVFLDEQPELRHIAGETVTNGRKRQTGSADSQWAESLQQRGSQLAAEAVSPYVTSLEARKAQLEELFRRLEDEEGVKIDSDLLDMVRQGAKHVRDTCLTPSVLEELPIPSLHVS